MNTPNIIAAAALSLLAASGALAQGFEPVQPLKAVTSRGEVAAEARAAARDGNPYGDVVAAPLTSRPSSLDRASVRAQAVAAAHAPNQNLDRRAFVNSEVPPQFQGPGR
ncbi:alpha/beta hydrolase [Variovorax sp. W6]|uniref:alpha/beta hydrolase n=1 Tax=Variovorax sp. W6 TaxID=3093895 RepID=UPI003D805021